MSGKKQMLYRHHIWVLEVLTSVNHTKSRNSCSRVSIFCQCLLVSTSERVSSLLRSLQSKISWKAKKKHHRSHLELPSPSPGSIWERDSWPLLDPAHFWHSNLSRSTYFQSRQMLRRNLWWIHSSCEWIFQVCSLWCLCRGWDSWLEKCRYILCVCSASVRKCEDLLSGQGPYCVFHSLGTVVRKIIRGFPFTKCYWIAGIEMLVEFLARIDTAKSKKSKAGNYTHLL